MCGRTIEKCPGQISFHTIDSYLATYDTSFRIAFEWEYPISHMALCARRSLSLEINLFSHSPIPLCNYKQSTMCVLSPFAGAVIMSCRITQMCFYKMHRAMDNHIIECMHCMPSVTSCDVCTQTHTHYGHSDIKWVNRKSSVHLGNWKQKLSIS